MDTEPSRTSNPQADGDFGDEGGVGAEGGLNFGREAAGGVVGE
jgi:hypothetical protein